MRMTGATRLVFILAYPVGHVRAPLLYNSAFAASGLDWSLVPLGVAPADLVATTVQLARLTNLQGLNVTMPHKLAACKMCGRLGAEAQRTGVVNTMRLESDGEWSGESFDGAGFIGAAREHGLLGRVPLLEESVMIFGAGGAGRAIAFALAREGVREIHVIDIDEARASALLAALLCEWPDMLGQASLQAFRGASLVVNATPLGMHEGDALPFSPDALKRDASVFDIVAARGTELVAACRARGLRAIDGVPMIEHQISAQTAFWRGTEALEPSESP